jgi:hypothetical protein
VLLKDLPNPLRLNRTHTNGNSFKKYVENLAGPMPHGFTWGLVLLKDRVMTVAPSLFGISWHRERRTKNKMTQFLPVGIFSIFVPILEYYEKSSLVCVSLSIRRDGSQSVDTEVKSQR